MNGVFRRITPRNRVLAGLVWAGVVAGFSAVLWFFVFPYIDRFVPGAGMF